MEIRRHFGAEDRVLRVLGKGDLLGELALFRNNAPRSANAVARGRRSRCCSSPPTGSSISCAPIPRSPSRMITQLAKFMLEAEDRARAADERARAAEDKLKGGASEPALELEGLGGQPRDVPADRERGGGGGRRRVQHVDGARPSR